VVSDCLAWALESGQDTGVWGGLGEDERRALKRRSALAPVHWGWTPLLGRCGGKLPIAALRIIGSISPDAAKALNQRWTSAREAASRF
jgi:hypothetical protein